MVEGSEYGILCWSCSVIFVYMEKLNKHHDLEQIVMKGLHLAVKKLIEQSIRDNQPLVVSIDGKIQKIYPKKAS